MNSPRTDVHDEQRSGGPSLISDDRFQAANFYDSGIQKLGPRLNVWTMPATMLKNSYVQAIHSQCRFCKLKMLYMVKTFVSLLSRHASYYTSYVFIIHIKRWGSDFCVSVVTRWTVWGSNPLWARDFFLFRSVQTGSGPTQLYNQLVLLFFHGSKAAGA